MNYYLRIFPVREESNWSAHARGHTPFPTERAFMAGTEAERLGDLDNEAAAAAAAGAWPAVCPALPALPCPDDPSLIEDAS